MKIQTNFRPIHYWGYERAYVDHIFFTFERDKDWFAVEQFLCDWAKIIQDNKVVWKLVHIRDANQVLYIMFKDMYVHIGTGIRPYRGSELHPGQVIEV